MKKFFKFALAVFAVVVFFRACVGCGAEKKDVIQEEKIPVIDNGKTNVLMYPSDSVYMAEVNLEGSGWKRMGDTFVKDNWIAMVKEEPEWVKIETVLMADNQTGKIIADELRDYYLKIYSMFHLVEGGCLWGVYDGKIYDGQNKEQTDQYILMEYLCDGVRYCRVTYATKKKNNN